MTQGRARIDKISYRWRKRDEWQKAYDLITEEEKQALWERWTGSDESAKVLPEQSWPGSNGTVQAAVCDTLEPMSYAGEGGKLIGFDVEMILLMAEKLDVHVEFTGMEFAAILATVQSGKATAIVGYVAVQDLTKMGDIVRSRTLEAFFPLIAVAVIYFILAAILTWIVKRIEICIDPKHRSTESIQKEVEEV